MKKWTQKEYIKFSHKLEKLSLDQLKILSSMTGIAYPGDPEMAQVSKEELILTMDETDSMELKKAYKEILNQRPNRKG